MKIIAFLILGFVLVLEANAAAQIQQQQQVPKTKLEAFEAQQGVVIINGFSTTGDLRGMYGGIVSVMAEEFTNPTTGKHELGIAIEVKQTQGLERTSRSFIEYEEIGGLIKGLDYIGRLNKSVTKLDNFQGIYRTKGDLAITTFNTGNEQIMVSVESGRISSTHVFLHLEDLATLKSYISAARDRLDGIKR